MIFKTQFFWRIYLSFVVVVLLSISILSGLLVSQVADDEFEKVNIILQSQADLIARISLEFLIDVDEEQLRRLVDSLSENTGSRFTIINSEGVVLADSHQNPLQMDNHLQRPEVLEAVVSGSGYASRFSQTLQQQLNYFALSVNTEQGNLGFVRTAFAVTEILQQIEQEQETILGYCSLVALLALLAGFVMANKMAKPLALMSTLTVQIAKGDFDLRLPVENSEGLGKLSQAINELARNSAQRVSEITSDRNRLAAIFTGMVEGVIDVDQNQKIIHINDAASSLLGISAKASLNQPIWEVIRIKEITSALDKAISTQGVIKSQMRLSREADELVVDIYAASLSTDSGEPIGAVIVLNNITDLENLERVRADFVANASHELKTPITAIRGLSETILSYEDVDVETNRRFVGRIHSQSLRLSQLISDLMTISMLESSENVSDFTVMDMEKLVKNAVQAAKPGVEAKNQSLSLEIGPGEFKLRGDRQNLSQLLDNLIDNAIKYSPEGGEIKIALRKEKGSLVFSVKDNGIGINPQDQQRIFERFYRVDKVRSLSLGGTGLGLSIVKNILEKHGGFIKLESQLGQGSTFIAGLPSLD